MAPPDLALPAALLTIAPPDVDVVERWAATWRTEIASLREQRLRLEEEAEMAERAADVADDPCPVEFAAAVDAMLEAATARLEEELDAARNDSVARVVAVVGAGRVDAEWVAQLSALGAPRPRPARDLWRELRRDPAANEDEIEARTTDDAVYADFWRGAPTASPIRSSLRRLTGAQ